jgi:hypothetical protein
MTSINADVASESAGNRSSFFDHNLYLDDDSGRRYQYYRSNFVRDLKNAASQDARLKLVRKRILNCVAFRQGIFATSDFFFPLHREWNNGNEEERMLQSLNSEIIQFLSSLIPCIRPWVRKIEVTMKEPLSDALLAALQ